MYGDDDDYGKRETRPLSFVTSPLSEPGDVEFGGSYFDSPSGPGSRPSPSRPYNTTNGNLGFKSHTLPASLPSHRHSSFDTGPLSPSLSLRESNHGANDTVNKSFPLNDIDYESNPAAVAQELSNLQALRRMSMDVGNTSDPDLPSFQGVSLMPSVAPRGGDDEDDPSRLFWVPARVHPELAPMEFKTFLENRVQSIKRRSGEQSSLSAENPERSGSGGGLRRKKSMLSRQIDDSYSRGANGYRDGAEQLEQKKPLSQQRTPELKISDLKDLDELVKDPSRAMKKLTLDTTMRSDPGVEVTPIEDMPILPAAPGNGLRRSTRTTYRRGSLRKGERVPFSKRAGARAETDGEESPISSPVNHSAGYPLTRTPSEPITENFSRPGRPGRRAGNLQLSSSAPTASYGHFDSRTGSDEVTSSPLTLSSIEASSSEPLQYSLPPRKSSFVQPQTQIPQIIETPPADDRSEEPPPNRSMQYPDRPSAQTPPTALSEPPVPEEPPPRSSKRPILGRQASSTTQTIPKVSPAKTLNDMAQHPSPLPGGVTKTDTLTFIPTSHEEKKPDKKSKKDEPESPSVRKTSWGWFKGSDDKDKKDKKKDDEAKRGKTRTALDKAHDSARLDVLQHSIDNATVKGRESLLLDRDSIDNRLQDERKKESTRKSSEGKKEKDGIFSSLFGGKKKGDRDPSGKKGGSLRTLSPEPPYRQLKPDVDYNWTRFSILEERAIYRMAHIKLANPRRALYSQVLLSNFMYSYLAKVQQMHPHVQIAQSPQQKKQQELERKQKEEEKRRLEGQQGADQYRYDYHQVCQKSNAIIFDPLIRVKGIADYADSPNQKPQPTEGTTYVDDSQIYDYDHQENDHSHKQGADRPQSRASQHSTENGYGVQNPSQNLYGRQGQEEYYQYGHSERVVHNEADEDDEMW
jgi:Activator of mitotic machinery Cdc14 phosphatase activation C-term